ncbi:MAG: 50S ribosomal protein L21e [Nanoarchaeota archaeon]
MARKGGSKRKTRHIFKKHMREKGKISIRRFLHEFKAGDKVVLKGEPAYQKGLYFRRFHGKQGIIVSRRGFCYLVAIKDANKEKAVYVHPVHLREVTT